MPVLLAGGNLHDVSRLDFLDGATPLLNAPGAGGDDQDLASGMRVPSRAGAGLEGDGPATRVRGVDRFEQHLHTNPTCETLHGTRADVARAAARDDDRLCLRCSRSEQADHAEHRLEPLHPGPPLKAGAPVPTRSRWM